MTDTLRPYLIQMVNFLLEKKSLELPQILYLLVINPS